MSNTTQNTKAVELPVGFETDPAEDLKAREELMSARIALLLKASWFGNMATRLKLVNADAWLPTAATDGRHFFYNSKFVLMLDDKELEFLFGHEVLHNVYEHLGRSKDHKHDQQLANIAADYVVNQDLVDQKIGRLITTVPALQDNKFRGWAMEEVYEYLYDNAEKINLEDLIDQMLDEHLDGDDSDSDGNGSGDITEDENGNLKSGSKPRYSPEEKRKIRDEIKEAMINAAKQESGGSGAGKMPAGVKRMIKDLTEPKMNWRELLELTLKSSLKSDFSWMRPSRKGWHSNVIMPGMVPEDTIDICVSIDMSGSISQQQAKDFLSEIAGIMSMYTDFKIRLWTFDTKVYGYAEFDATNMDEFMEYVPQGGGGTMFECNWEFMKENEIEPERFVMFTDGYPCGTWGDPDYCDTVFIIHGPENIKPTFGAYAHYDLATKN